MLDVPKTTVFIVSKLQLIKCRMLNHKTSGWCSVHQCIDFSQCTINHVWEAKSTRENLPCWSRLTVHWLSRFLHTCRTTCRPCGVTFHALFYLATKTVLFCKRLPFMLLVLQDQTFSLMTLLRFIA